MSSPEMKPHFQPKVLAPKVPPSLRGLLSAGVTIYFHLLPLLWLKTISTVKSWVSSFQTERFSQGKGEFGAPRQDIAVLQLARGVFRMGSGAVCELSAQRQFDPQGRTS